MRSHILFDGAPRHIVTDRFTDLVTLVAAPVFTSVTAPVAKEHGRQIMIDRGKKNVLGVLVDAVDYEHAVETIVRAARDSQPLGVTALAVHGVMTGATNDVHRHRLNQLGLVLPDGQPVRWALNRLHGAALSDRVYGPTLMLKTCQRAAEEGIPVFLFGGDDPMLKSLVAALRARFPSLDIAGTRPSRFRRIDAEEHAEMLDEIRSSQARIVFVGLGCPRQEVFVYENVHALGMPMLAVGAAFAFHAGMLDQAPAWMQRWGLEWFYRFLKEPRRLWHRYLVLNPMYVTMIGLQALGLRRRDPLSTRPPTDEMCFG